MFEFCRDRIFFKKCGCAIQTSQDDNGKIASSCPKGLTGYPPGTFYFIKRATTNIFVIPIY